MDWVSDLLPKTNDDGSKSETGQRQLADAKREKAREEGTDESRKMGDVRKRKEKFDLARFYGGLMIKLREDGF